MIQPPVVTTLTPSPLFPYPGSLSLLREDLLPIPGNKYWKLKYALSHATCNNLQTVVSFGGAYSNHLHALAAGCRQTGLQAVGFVRGEKTKSLNPTLRDCQRWGMHLYFLSRTDFKQGPDSDRVREILLDYIGVFVVAMGGADHYGFKGSQQLYDRFPGSADILAVSAGTFTVAAGLLSRIRKNQEVWIFPALSGLDSQHMLKKHFLNQDTEVSSSYRTFPEAAGKGFAKLTPELVQFIKDFYSTYGIVLDAVYTSKMLYHMQTLIRQNKVPADKSIVALHSGGVQGNRGFNQKLHLDLPE